MPIVLLLAVCFFIVLLAIVLTPVTLVQRYRVGTLRRPARGWVATLNLVAVLTSIGIFLVSAALTTIWVPGAFVYSLAGLAVGCGCGALGLALTRWEASPTALYYTPNRWLVLIVTLVVTVRLLYGFWRSWHSWQSAVEGGSWFVSAGVPGSLAAGAVVLGYYAVYWAGVRRRLGRHRRLFGFNDPPMPPSRGFAKRIR